MNIYDPPPYTTPTSISPDYIPHNIYISIKYCEEKKGGGQYIKTFITKNTFGTWNFISTQNFKGLTPRFIFEIS